MELKERVGNNVDVDWRIIFFGNIWKLKERSRVYNTTLD